MFLHLFVILFTVATEAGGTHPTGMHTCNILNLCHSHINVYKTTENLNFNLRRAHQMQLGHRPVLSCPVALTLSDTLFFAISTKNIIPRSHLVSYLNLLLPSKIFFATLKIFRRPKCYHPIPKYMLPPHSKILFLPATVQHFNHHTPKVFCHPTAPQFLHPTLKMFCTQCFATQSILQKHIATLAPLPNQKIQVLLNCFFHSCKSMPLVRRGLTRLILLVVRHSK